MQEKIKRAAIKLIAKHGYEAMTLRMLAQELDLKAPSLYNHVASKQDLLLIIIESNMEEFLMYMEKGLEGISQPIDRLDKFIELNVRYDCLHVDAVFVGKHEMRSLTEDNKKAIRKLTKRYEDMLIDILVEGTRKGQFSAEAPHMVAYAMFAMLTGVSTWFKPTKLSAIEEIQQTYRVLVRRMVQAMPTPS